MKDQMIKLKNNNNKNIIKGTFEVEDIHKDVELFNQIAENEGFDVYLNDKKIKVIKSYKIVYKNFNRQKGEYKFKIIFKNNLPNLERIFHNCSDIISLDLSDFDT